MPPNTQGHFLDRLRFFTSALFCIFCVPIFQPPNEPLQIFISLNDDDSGSLNKQSEKSGSTDPESPI
ncbi:MAG: hypothetical protein A2Y76_08575 [Planctomycetes bacterium RBG_13_60_9]|nr:MAG: hypothetical protein A2Y76_08575 [Planctomycetes bacterium RBG_13_60_9]